MDTEGSAQGAICLEVVFIYIYIPFFYWQINRQLQRNTRSIARDRYCSLTVGQNGLSLIHFYFFSHSFPFLFLFYSILSLFSGNVILWECVYLLQIFSVHPPYRKKKWRNKTIWQPPTPTKKYPQKMKPVSREDKENIEYFCLCDVVSQGAIH